MPQMHDLKSGEVLLDKYQIKRVLGAGGMGTVYHARQTDLGRDVAIKVPRPEALEIPGFLARFTREARTVAKLQHENIVQIYEYYENGSEILIVMEFVEGQDLQGFIRQPPKNLKVKDVAQILAASCEGLSAAHEIGIVHRDIKPQNIMVGGQRKGKWRVKIMDFGIAHVDPSANLTGVEAQLTQTGQAIGTPSYMAPEQIKGAGVTPLSDIYSFGCVMFYVFSRRTPFTGTGYTIAAKHLSEAAPSVRMMLPMLPPEYDNLVRRCMEKEPEFRPREAHELAEMIRQTLAPIGETEMADIWNRLSLGEGDMIPGAINFDPSTQRGKRLADGTEESDPTVPSGPQDTIPSPVPGSGGPGGAATIVAPLVSTAPVDGPRKTSMPGTDATSFMPKADVQVSRTSISPSRTGAAPPPGATPPITAQPAGVPEPAAKPAGGFPVAIVGIGATVVVLGGVVIGLMVGGGKDPGSTPGAEPTPTPVVASAGDPRPTPTPTPAPIASPSPADAAPAVPKASPTPSPIPSPSPDADVQRVEGFKRRFAEAETSVDRLSIAAEFQRLAVSSGSAALLEASSALALQAAQQPALVSIKPGTFSMGSTDGNADERPVNNVTLSGYEIGEHEVSALEFATFLNTLPAEESRRLYRPDGDAPLAYNEAASRWLPIEGRDLHPATFVTWTLAVRYAEWLSAQTGQTFRLPTEAEWERAAKGPTQASRYPWGNSAPDVSKARFAAQSTVAISDLRDGKSADGILHLSGNVSEWCLDWYDKDAYQVGNRKDPTGPDTQPGGRSARRVLRGGGFGALTEADLTTTRRDRLAPDETRNDVGFRLVKVP